jgi:chaperonin cofactor prefoldin
MTKDEITNRIEELYDEIEYLQSQIDHNETLIENLEYELERQINHENGDDIIIGDSKNA